MIVPQLTTASTAGELSPTTSKEGHLDKGNTNNCTLNICQIIYIILKFETYTASYVFLLEGSDIASRDRPLNFQIPPAVKTDISMLWKSLTQILLFVNEK